MSDTVRGLTQPFRGLLFLLRHGSLWKLALVPLLINLVVVVAVSVLLFAYFDEGFALATSFLEARAPESWYRWPDFALLTAIRYLIGGVLVLVSLVLVYFVFLLAGSIVAAPFSDALSSRTELLRGGSVPPEGKLTLVALMRDGAGALADALRKAGFFLGVFALLLPLHLIPIVGSALYTLLSGVFAMHFVTLEFVDPCLTRRRLDFRAKRLWLARHRGAVLGFGAVMFAVLLVPIVNVLVLPVGAVAGTFLYLELEGGGTRASSASSMAQPMASSLSS